MTFSRLLDVASVHCAWHFSLCGSSSMWSPPVYSSFCRICCPVCLGWQNGRDAAAQWFSHVWPLIRTACVCACVVCLYACSPVCVKRRNPEIERMAQLWSVCLGDSSLHHSVLVFDLLQSTVAWCIYKTSALLLVSFHWVTLCAKWISSSKHQGHTLQQQTHRDNLDSLASSY